jgi:hypothetical protein
MSGMEEALLTQQMDTPKPPIGIFKLPCGYLDVDTNELHDEIEVVGFSGACPRVRLLGRSNATSDLVGEKLHEQHVRSVVDRVLAEFGLTARFRMLAPVQGTPSRYRLFVEAQGAAQDGCSDDLAAALDAGLSKNPYYEHALRLGQLAGCDVLFLQRGARSAWDVYEGRCLARGQRAGDIKPVALDAWTGWVGEFSTESGPDSYISSIPDQLHVT